MLGDFRISYIHTSTIINPIKFDKIANDSCRIELDQCYTYQILKAVTGLCGYCNEEIHWRCVKYFPEQDSCLKNKPARILHVCFQSHTNSVGLKKYLWMRHILYIEVLAYYSVTPIRHNIVSTER